MQTSSPLSDPSNQQPPIDDAVQSAQPQQAVQNPLTTSAPAPASSQTPQQANQPSQPASLQNPSANDVANHPSVKRASILSSVAEALAGGPRYALTSNPDGTVTRTPVPLSKRDIGLAIAMEAISGSLAGLAQRGPGSVGRAAEAGFQQVSTQQQQAQQQAEAQAQQDANAKANAIVRAASIHEQNARTVLATQQAERLGIESLKDSVSQNAALLQSYNDAGAVSEQNVDQDSLLDGMKSGKYSSTTMTAIPDGWTNVNGRWEQTFSIVNNPAAKVNLTSDMVRDFSANHVPGFPKSMTVAATGVPVAGYIIAKANLQSQANKMFLQEAGDIANTLAKSGDKGNQELAKSIPDLGNLMDDQSRGLAFQQALPKLQKYMHGGDDLYDALVAMSQPTRPNPSDPKQSISNTGDASASQVIAGAFGNGDVQKGWSILKAYHNEITPEPIKNEADAASIIANHAPGSRPYQIAQQWITTNNAEKAAQARADAEARASVAAATNAATSGQPYALGYTPNVAAMGGIREYNKRLSPYKKNLDDLARTEASYQQFANTLQNIAAGNAMSGADSVVSLFNAIGLSATPLAGRGFRITENTIKEHEQARGWGQAIQAKLLNAKDGDVITPQQLKDYAAIAVQARQSQYIDLVNQMHNVGLNADAALPTGNGQHIDVPTARIFMQLAGGDANKARAAAVAKGWQF